MKQALRVAMAQPDLCVGDIWNNAARIVAAAQSAREQSRADVIVFPEMALTGCPPDDLLYRDGFRAAVQQALPQLASQLTGITAVVGHPLYDDGVIYSAVSVYRAGQCIATACRHGLDGNDLLDEARYYGTGSTLCTFAIGDDRVAVLPGEDIRDDALVSAARRAGAGLVLNPAAVPFHVDSRAEREAAVTRCAETHGLAVCHVNHVGGRDDMVFDGVSLLANDSGRLVHRGPAFDAGIQCIDLPSPGSGEPAAPLSDDAAIYAALVRATRDYVEYNGFPGVVLGASGGIDSALTMAVAVDAVGGDRVQAVSMPSRYTADMSNSDAAEQARRLGVRHEEIPIETAFDAFLKTLAPQFSACAVDATEENLQARIRGTLLMALSNKFGPLLLVPGNKSEMAVGYTTLYGDMCGGFAPLKDVSKTRVYRLARYRNTRSSVIPERVINRPPSAELRAGQADSDSLPDYDTLDAIIEQYVEADASVESICAQGHDADTVERVAGLIRRNEYKRRQSAPGPAVTRRPFARARRYPITARWAGM